MELLGCDRKTLLSHIESQFSDGMSWENRGKWHIDHKIPFHMVDVLNPEHLKVVCHYTNLRPLWGKDNLTRTYEDVDLSKLVLS